MIQLLNPAIYHSLDGGKNQWKKDVTSFFIQIFLMAKEDEQKII